MTPLGKLVGALAGRRIAVVGDVCLDEYIVGRPSRLSREAPVPVLEFDRRFTRPGAAANPALNVQALGGKAIIFTAVGDDEPGNLLVEQLADAGVDVSGVVRDPHRPTSVKTRVLAEVSLQFPQQVARIDRVVRAPVPAAARSALIDRLANALETGRVDAILFSDYKSGVIDHRLAADGAKLAARHGHVITSDTQGDVSKYSGFSVVKVNRPDAEAELRRPLHAADDYLEAGRALIELTSARAVVITRGSDGLSLIGPEGHIHVPSANPGEIVDVTGAGDTVIAVLTLALAAGSDLEPAVRLANTAAGLVVRKLGNAVVTPEELATAVTSTPFDTVQQA